MSFAVAPLVSKTIGDTDQTSDSLSLLTPTFVLGPHGTSGKQSDLSIRSGYEGDMILPTILKIRLFRVGFSFADGWLCVRPGDSRPEVVRGVGSRQFQIHSRISLSVLCKQSSLWRLDVSSCS
jgi:hypothetical protein